MFVDVIVSYEDIQLIAGGDDEQEIAVKKSFHLNL